MTDLLQLMEQDKHSQAWAPEVRQAYLRFHDRLSAAGPLAVKVGNGGLSFYKNGKTGSVFVCHFNARPRKNQPELGFADFRFDALRDHLDTDTIIGAFREDAPSGVEVKVNKLWCSLHFPLTLADQIADLFVEHIIKKVTPSRSEDSLTS